MHFVLCPRVGILDAEGFVMSYFIVSLLFRRNVDCYFLTTDSLTIVFLRGVNSSIFLYILLIIN